MAFHNTFGKWGEDVAVNYLLERGFDILARNWRHERKEVDIIAQREGKIYFIEVKTRHGEKWNAEESITAKKRVLLSRAMIAWKLQHPSSMPVRFSAIAVVSHGMEIKPEIRWHENLWDL